jgi:acyl-CoA reductase-like NAD-dependent aldehyde dehydrogenase
MTGRFEIVSPVDGSVYATLSYADEAMVDAAVTRARTAQREWYHTTLGTRAERCDAFVRAMEKKTQDIAIELARLMGRPVRFGPGEVKRLGERA